MTDLFEKDGCNEKGDRRKAGCHRAREKVRVCLPKRSAEDIREPLMGLRECASYDRSTEEVSAWLCRLWFLCLPNCGSCRPYDRKERYRFSQVR